MSTKNEKLADAFEAPEEIMMTAEEVRAHVMRADIIMTTVPLVLERYCGDGYVTIPANQKMTVMAIGSGSGFDDVIAAARAGDVVIPPWYLHTVIVWSYGPNR
jgi:hypothetical protein